VINIIYYIYNKTDNRRGIKMKKVLLICAILAIFGVLIALIATKTPVADPIKPFLKSNDNSENIVASDAQLSEVTLSSPPGETGAYFKDVVISPLATDFTITGAVYDDSANAPISDLNVDVYCNNKKLFSGKTGTLGQFSINGQYGDCNLGGSVSLLVYYHEQFFTNDMQMPGVVFMSLANSANNDNSFSQKTAGVPEFGTAGLVAAVLGVGLGLALLRKH
jgi:hypothetical protein